MNNKELLTVSKLLAMFVIALSTLTIIITTITNDDISSEQLQEEIREMCDPDEKIDIRLSGFTGYSFNCSYRI
tara:strand:- start:253 stop:471 length:219 start_codon:yes stop_codon:yes gene_type:complete